jgi:hypothetical protein
LHYMKRGVCRCGGWRWCSLSKEARILAPFRGGVAASVSLFKTWQRRWASVSCFFLFLPCDTRRVSEILITSVLCLLQEHLAMVENGAIPILWTELGRLFPRFNNRLGRLFFGNVFGSHRLSISNPLGLPGNLQDKCKNWWSCITVGYPIIGW